MKRLLHFRIAKQLVSHLCHGRHVDIVAGDLVLHHLLQDGQRDLDAFLQRQVLR